jgi:selenocysteine lyase/cysteine desulfurase
LGGKLPVDEIVEIVKDRNPDTLCIVDGAHTLGQLRIDVKRINCDFYAVNAHKFGLGLPAFAALYTNARYLEELGSTRNHKRFPIYDSYAVSSRFRTDEELGTINGAAIVSFNEAFTMLYDHYGIDRVQARILSLAKYFVEYVQKDKTLAPVSPLTPELISGVNCFTIKNHSYDEYSKLVEVLENKYKIICKALKRPPCIRICLHYFNSENDIDRFFEALRKEAVA